MSNAHNAVFWIIQYGGTDNEAWLKGLVADFIGNQGKYYTEQNKSLDEIYNEIARELLGAKITAFTFDDINKNGKFDTGEPPLASVAAKLIGGTNPETKTTGEDGKAEFPKLCPKPYTLSTTAPAGYTASPKGSDRKQLTITPGADITQNFGFIKGGAGEITFNLKFALHGVGIAGDNVVLRPAPCQKAASASANAGGTKCLNNQKPMHQQRTVVVELIDDTGKVAGKMDGVIEYNTASGLFEGTGFLRTQVKPGVYTFRAATPMFLKKKFVFQQEIQPGKSYTLPVVDLTSSDVDNDNRLTILDYNMITNCYTFPDEQPKCSEKSAALVDVDDNGQNDEFDVNLLTRDVSVLKGD